MNIFVVPGSESHSPKERDEVYLLTSYNKNVSVFQCHDKQYLYNLSIENREMACSRQHKNKFFVGTFCDTLFMFIYDHMSKKLVLSSEMRVHESIISIAILTNELLICGQSNGYLDTITCRPSKKIPGEYRLDNVASKFCSNLGYINCIQVCNKASDMPDNQQQDQHFELALACETGLYFGDVTGYNFTLNESDFYFPNQTVS